MKDDLFEMTMPNHLCTMVFNVRLHHPNDPLDQYVHRLMLLLKSYSQLVEPHAFAMARSLGRSHLDRFWPKEWIAFVDDQVKNGRLDAFQEELLDLLKIGSVPTYWPKSLQSFINDCQTLSLPRNVLASDLPPSIYLTSCPSSEILRASQMSQKKFHEVDRLAQLIFEEASCHQIDIVVDVGSGSGYLTHKISQKYPIVAIDGDGDRTGHSSKRGEHFYSKETRQVIHVTLNLDPDSFCALLDQIWLTKDGNLVRDANADLKKHTKPRILITALHACGNLSTSTILTAYRRISNIKSIVIVGCCYQLLTPSGFPLSSVVKDECGLEGDYFPFSLSPLSRTPQLQITYRLLNCACQTMVGFSRQRIKDTWLSFTYRALLESVLDEHGVQVYNGIDKDLDNGQAKIKVGTLNREAYAHGFQHYASLVCNKMGVDLSHDQLTRCQAFLDANVLQGRIALTCTVKRILGPCIESLVLLDRLLYTSEISSNAQLLNLFEHDQSPRNMVLRSWREECDRGE